MPSALASPKKSPVRQAAIAEALIRSGANECMRRRLLVGI
jgi:hypothetical protein